MEKRTKNVMIKKIVITGPESCGKTTLVNSLAELYNCNIVHEFARKYLKNLNRKYIYEDLLKIGKGQEREENKVLNLEKKIMLCDTGIHTIKIWSLDKFNKCDDIYVLGHGGNLAIADHAAVDITRLSNGTKNAMCPGSGIVATSLINALTHLQEQSARFAHVTSHLR